MKNVYPPLYTLNGEVIKEVDSVIYFGNVFLRKCHILCSLYTHCAIMVEPHCIIDYMFVNCYINILLRLLRRISYCSASGLFAECGIPNCKAVIRSLIYKFMSRLNESTNDVKLAILSSDIRWTSLYGVIG